MFELFYLLFFGVGFLMGAYFVYDWFMEDIERGREVERL